MKIIVSHLTRMQRGFVCVAGVDVKTLKHVRPVQGGRLPTDSLARHGGPFDMAYEVDLGSTVHVGKPPEMEDHRFDLRQAYRLNTVDPTRFWRILQGLARTRLSEIFGPSLTPKGSGCIVDVGQGHASLGCLIPPTRPRLYLKPRPDQADLLRIQFDDGQFHVDVAVTDIRFYKSNHVTPDEAVVSQFARRLDQGVPVILGVGLTRPYTPTPDSPPAHWLQVTNLHLEDDPAWRLG